MPMQPGSALIQEDVDPYTYRHHIDREADAVRTLVLIAPRPADESASAKWAIVQHHVAGWHCVATGGFVAETPEEMAAALEREYGDGFDRIPRDYYRLTHPAATNVHQLRSLAPGKIAAYCGVPAATPYVYRRGPCFQHCLKCTTAYRAEHFGRCPIEER